MASATEEWVAHFKKLLETERESSTAVVAMATLVEFLRQSKAETLSELRDDLKAVMEALTMSRTTAITSVSSGCELFLRFITLKATDFHKDFDEYKQRLVETGQQYLKKAVQGRSKIAPKGLPFVRDGTNLLTISRSRVVLATLMEAARRNRRFTVYCTESRPSMSGLEMAKSLKEAGIPVVVIPDAAVGYIIEKMDFVMVGAEAVVESGGIVNTIGTYQASVIAKANNKPFYAVAESFKFLRSFPLSQADIPPPEQEEKADESDIEFVSPLMDYTPPSFISLLFTDLGVLTPSAVSDELIKLYS